MVKDLVGPNLNSVNHKDAAAEDGPNAFVDTTRIARNKWRPQLADSDWSALCQALSPGVEQEDWFATFGGLRDAAKKIAKVWRVNQLAVEAECEER